jgi:signal transduction histidine kinase
LLDTEAANDVYVLIVEDDRDDFFLTQDLLQGIERERYKVVWAGSCERAKLELRERKFDVALVDYRIGEKTGLDFISEFGPLYPHCPMILLTGLSDPGIDYAAERAGAVDYLVKDALTEALLDRSIRYARKSAQRRAMLDNVLSNSASGMIGFDAKGAPIIWNRRAIEALELTSLPRSQLTPAMVAAALDRVRANGNQPLVFSISDGRSFEVSSSRAEDGSGVIVLHDITLRVEAEQHLRRAVEAAEAANNAKSSFLATMSHELRTPLNGILGMARHLQGTQLSEVQKDSVDVIKDSGTILLNIINDILDLSKIEAGRMELEQVEFDVPEVVDDVLRLLWPVAKDKGIELVGFADPLIAPAHRGDPLRVRQIVTNLVGNAIKFTEAGSVTLSVDETLQRGKRMLRFSVSDTGIGIPADKLARLFTKFTQVDSSTTRLYGGTGLGLALCKELVGLMQGEITCESMVGRGSTFRCMLPAPAEAEAVALARRAKVQLPSARLLLVGAGEAIGGAVGAYARALASQLATAASADAARSALEAAQFAAIIVDGTLGDAAVDAIGGLVRGRAPRSPCLFVLEAAPGQAGRLGLADSETLGRPFTRAVFDKLVSRLRSEACSSQPPAPVEASAEEGRSLRILMAEDNVANQRVATAMLKSAGFRVEIVGNGRLAVERATEAEFDVVLMDVRMPVLDGIGATRELRRSPKGHLLPIIGMTAGAMGGDRENCLEAGMNEHLSKPVDWDKLIALLDSIERERYGD